MNKTPKKTFTILTQKKTQPNKVQSNEIEIKKEKNIHVMLLKFYFEVITKRRKKSLECNTKCKTENKKQHQTLFVSRHRDSTFRS